ncbi:Chymosin [Dactylella cylindrospora]|nr:Chymosin [Dactylella cylindrospora]
MHSISTSLVAALLLVEATAGYVHLELKTSTEARSRLARREFGLSDISHQPTTPWYYVEVYVGNPPQRVRLRLEDRATTWLPWLNRIARLGDCQREYDDESMCNYATIAGLFDPSASTTFNNVTDGPDLFVNYTTSETTGIFGSDSLSLNQVTVVDQTIGLATSFNTSPALGVGMPEDTVAYPYNSFLSNLESQGMINSLVYSIYLNDLFSNGDIYFGAIDEAKFYGTLQKFDNNGVVGHVIVKGVWWVLKNGTTEPLVTPNREESTYSGDGSVSFGSTFLELPEEVYDAVREKFDLEEKDEKSVPLNERTPSYRLGEPFLRGTYAVFDYTNKQTLLAPAFINATGSQIVEVGEGGAAITGTGHPLPNDLKRIPSLDHTDFLDAPGTPTQPASDPAQSKGIIVGGLLGGIVFLVLALGAVYAIRPRSQRSSNIRSWFTFLGPKKKPASPEPVIAYPTRHDSKYYQSGTTRINPVNYGPPEEMGNGVVANGNGSPTTPQQSYYVNTAFRPTRLSNVDEGVELGSSSRYQQANRYGHVQ